MNVDTKILEVFPKQSKNVRTEKQIISKDTIIESLA